MHHTAVLNSCPSNAQQTQSTCSKAGKDCGCDVPPCSLAVANAAAAGTCTSADSQPQHERLTVYASGWQRPHLCWQFGLEQAFWELLDRQDVHKQCAALQPLHWQAVQNSFCGED